MLFKVSGICYDNVVLKTTLENVYLRIRSHKAILQMTVVNKRGIYDAEKSTDHQ